MSSDKRNKPGLKTDLQHVGETIRRAISIPPGPKRDGYVYGYCGGDADLIRRVRLRMGSTGANCFDKSSGFP